MDRPLSALGAAASEIEEAQIRRVAARGEHAGNAWLEREGVAVGVRGSYFNNTNARLGADMDLWAVHPLVRIEYH